MDDGIIVCNDKDKLRNLLCDIRSKCSKLGLCLNDKKSRIYELKEGFTYLEFRYNLLDSSKILMKIPRVKRRKIVRYLDSLDSNNIEDRLVFYWDYLLKGNNYLFYKKLNNRVKSKEIIKK